MKITTAALCGILLLSALNASAELPARATEFTWDSEGMVSQKCTASVDHYAHGFYRTDPEGHVVFWWDTKDGQDEHLSWSLAWSVGNSHHAKAIEVERANCGRNSWCTRAHVEIADLRGLVGADKAVLRLDTVAARDAFISQKVFDDLFEQWARHWCEDPDGDGVYSCGGIEHPPTVFIPPMRNTEQKALAACIENHHIAPAQQATSMDRVELPLVGIRDWAGESAWAQDCPEVESVDRPVGMPWEPRPPATYCAAFTIHPYFQDGHCQLHEESWADVDGTPMSGHRLRYRFDRKYGEFPGFVCPEPNATGTATKASVMRSLRSTRTLMRAVR